jgi:cellulose synthase/poly-beta-1,6-N-acetylglucosamine synthase-like glycosyltransferase
VWHYKTTYLLQELRQFVKWWWKFCHQLLLPLCYESMLGALVLWRRLTFHHFLHIVCFVKNLLLWLFLITWKSIGFYLLIKSWKNLCVAWSCRLLFFFTYIWENKGSQYVNINVGSQLWIHVPNHDFHGSW